LLSVAKKALSVRTSAYGLLDGGGDLSGEREQFLRKNANGTR
jgi:hypothetical protein